MIRVEEFRAIAERIAALSAIQIATSEAVNRAITQVTSAQSLPDIPQESSPSLPTVGSPPTHNNVSIAVKM